MADSARKPPEFDTKAPDFVALFSEAAPLIERGHQLMAEFLETHRDDFNFQMRITQQAAETMGTLAQQWMKDPIRLAQAQVAWWKDYLALVQQTGQQLAGRDTLTPGARDKRFMDTAWNENAVFNLIKQSYLLTARWTQALVKDTPDLDPHTQQKAAFYTRQFIDALSPTNFWLTNPAVLRAFTETGGENFIQGLRNMLRDLEAGQGQLRIAMTDMGAYTLGTNVATTPGSVVFRNDLIELIQYTPTTPSVNKTPLLIIPPWINKYYILDLRADNSFVQHALANGHTVFMISWVNPGAELAEKRFEDYMAEGPLAALDVIDSICGTTSTNIVGYCLGGTLLACLLSYLTAQGKADRVISATYLVTMLDFAEPGDLGVFIDEQQLVATEELMFGKGYLPGAAMGSTFNLLRANDLIWSFVINNYMLGQDPLPFDLLYWNADSTNMPAAMHSYYLRRMYFENRLVKPNSLAMLGVPVDLRTITTPAYMVATRDDHIAPWRSTFAATQVFSGPIEFVLGGSGHIAGIINPPAAAKYGYATGPKAATPDAWLAGSTEHTGSWWDNWATWMKQHAGGSVPARTVGNTAYPPLCPAPGDYVKVRA